LKGTTTNNTPTELLIDGNVGIILAGNKMNTFRILVVAKSDDNSEGAAYEIKGLIKKDITAASAALIGSITKTTIAESVAAWDITATADTSSGSLKINVTGANSKTIRWSAYIEVVEVT
jgi:hypothetical protein